MITGGFQALHGALLAANLTTSETAVLVVLIPSLFGLVNLLINIRMRRQMHPNGGKTLRDDVNKLRGEVSQILEYITTPKEHQ